MDARNDFVCSAGSVVDRVLLLLLSSSVLFSLVFDVEDLRCDVLFLTDDVCIGRNGIEGVGCISDFTSGCDLLRDDEFAACDGGA